MIIPNAKPATEKSGLVPKERSIQEPSIKQIPIVNATVDASEALPMALAIAERSSSGGGWCTAIPLNLLGGLKTGTTGITGHNLTLQNRPVNRHWENFHKVFGQRKTGDGFGLQRSASSRKTVPR